MSQPFFFDNSSLANSFMQELFIGFILNPNDGELFLKEARYDDLHNCFSIIISLDNGNDWIDVFTYESNYGNEIPPNPIKLEGQGIYKGVDCYAVVDWNAISDPSMAYIDGVVQFNETIICEAATNLDNSPTIKQYIYEHALDYLSGEAVAHNKFLRECINLPNVSEVTISVSNSQGLKDAISQNNNVIINLTCDIAIEKDGTINHNSLSSEFGNTSSIEHVNTLINFRGKNLIINGNGHKVYEKGTSFQVTPSQDGNWYEASFPYDVTGNEAFIKSDGTIIPLARSKMYKAKGWVPHNDLSSNEYGLLLPCNELNNLYLEENGNSNLFICYRLSYHRYTKKVTSITNSALFFEVTDENDDTRKIHFREDLTPKPDFYLINYMEDGDGALIKSGKVSVPSNYGSDFTPCWAKHLFRVKDDSNIVFNDVTFIGGLDYAVRNDSILRLNNCHFINQVAGGVVNLYRMIVDQCYFEDIFSIGVRFDHEGITNYSQDPYMEVTNSTFRNIAHWGTNTYAIRSTGKAYIAGNEFIDTNYGAILAGLVNSATWDYLHSIHLIERNYIHYTPEWIEKRKTFGLQDSGDIYVSVNNIMAVVRLNTIIGTGGIGGTSPYRKNNAIYVDDGAYNVKVYGNVISGTENYYDIDSRNVSNNRGYNRLTPNNHDANNVVYNDNHTDPNNPDRAYVDLSKDNLIAFNVCDGLVRMQENLTLNETGCRFINNFILDNFRSITQENMANIYNRVDDCLQSEGIIPDEYGMNSCAALWYLMYMNKKKSL